ncbi:hypothetical protein [Microbacterium sp. SSM24]|uniref:hypothetical protein n=1 Tax=Microbacterium sp. SSM24 TaxID=2991714 RepID=UPI0022280729|nr:hypothetical protein [Microbacterium sp. SSM24]MCW3493350.1 hypothetical protein [Microbacterium sp. SSM24]
MKHVTFADKSLLMGDAAAEALLEYARLIADTHGADSVTLKSISSDGNTVDASFLLNANTVLLIESTNSDVVAPDNRAATQEMQERIDAISRPASAQPEEPWPASDYDFPDLL